MTWPNEQYLFFQKGLSSADSCDGCGITFGSDLPIGGPPPPPPPPTPGSGGGGNLVPAVCECDGTLPDCTSYTTITPAWLGITKTVDCCCHTPTSGKCIEFSGSANYSWYINGTLRENRYMNFSNDLSARLQPPINWDFVNSEICNSDPPIGFAEVKVRYKYWDASGNLTSTEIYNDYVSFNCPTIVVGWPSIFAIPVPTTESINFSTRCNYVSYTATKTYTSGPDTHVETLFQQVALGSWATEPCCAT